MKNTEELTRKRIEGTFLTIFEKNEIHQISVKMVCDQAHVSRSTFYRYYDDVYDVLEVIGNTIVEQLYDIKRRHSISDYLDAVAYLREILSCIICHRTFFSRVLTTGVHTQFLERWKKIIKEDLREKYIRDSKPGWQDELSLEMVASGCLGLYRYYLFHMDEISEEHIIKRVLFMWEADHINLI